MNDPLVSIIVPTYNRSHLVIETLESIRAQRYANIELIIVDDGSKDDTAAVVTAWADEHRDRFPSLIVHPFPANKGKSEAVNYGFDHCSGALIMVFDSDDVLLPDAIGRQVEHLRQHPEIDCLACGAYLLQGDERTTTLFHPLRSKGDCSDIVAAYGDIFLNGNPVVSSSVLMKRAVVKGTGHLLPQLRICHDWDYWIRVARHFTVGSMDTPVLYYRINSDGSISQNKWKLFMEVMMVYELHHRRYGWSERMRALLYQIKYHLWLSRNDRSYRQFLRIAFSGSWLILRYALGGRT